MRNGFSLITAILFIVLVATLGAMALSFSTQGTKQTADIYLQSQAELLSRSAAEMALLAISAHDIVAENKCINEVKFLYPNNADPIFDVSVELQYFGTNTLPANCDIIYNDLQTNASDKTVLMDVYVKTVANIATEPISIHRRTLQKP